VIHALEIPAKRQASPSKADVVTCSTSYGENFVKGGFINLVLC
jgi:hypothetical protein